MHNGKKLVDTKVINCIEAIIAVLMEWTACPTTTQNKPDLIPYSSIIEKVDLVGVEPTTSSISLPICKKGSG
ncbi:MAG TPA: hypothetical protein VHF44_01425 [Nitrososphaeraceae archaeon]|nr:hypothetical protein [Nitrososphaeraceae archaeon]